MTKEIANKTKEENDTKVYYCENATNYLVKTSFFKELISPLHISTK